MANGEMRSGKSMEFVFTDISVAAVVWTFDTGLAQSESERERARCQPGKGKGEHLMSSTDGSSSASPFFSLTPPPPTHVTSLTLSTKGKD